MFIYNIRYPFTKKHYNPPFYGDYHSHEFIVNFELQGEIDSDFTDSYYGIDTVEFQKYLGRFIATLKDNLNEDPKLNHTSASTEAMAEMFLNEFPKYINDQGYKLAKNVTCLSISVFEGPNRETKLVVNKPIL